MWQLLCQEKMAENLGYQQKVERRTIQNNPEMIGCRSDCGRFVAGLLFRNDRKTQIAECLRYPGANSNLADVIPVVPSQVVRSIRNSDAPGSVRSTLASISVALAAEK